MILNVKCEHCSVALDALDASHPSQFLGNQNVLDTYEGMGYI